MVMVRAQYIELPYSVKEQSTCGSPPTRGYCNVLQYLAAPLSSFSITVKVEALIRPEDRSNVTSTRVLSLIFVPLMRQPLITNLSTVD